MGLKHFNIVRTKGSDFPGTGRGGCRENYQADRGENISLVQSYCSLLLKKVMEKIKVSSRYGWERKIMPAEWMCWFLALRVRSVFPAHYWEYTQTRTPNKHYHPNTWPQPYCTKCSWKHRSISYLEHLENRWPDLQDQPVYTPCRILLTKHNLTRHSNGEGKEGVKTPSRNIKSHDFLNGTKEFLEKITIH